MTGVPVGLAAALLLSFPLGLLGWAAGAAIDRLTDDPRLRSRLWALALAAPALPLLLAPAGLAWPAPLPTLPGELRTFRASPAEALSTAGAAPGWALDWPLAALALVAAAGLATAWRLGVLAMRLRRLRKLLAASRPAPPDLVEQVGLLAEAQRVRRPAVRVSGEIAEPLLTGLLRPTLTLPSALARSGSPALAAICGHELAHLKRRDHLALWAEEALCAALAINPLVRLIRGRLNVAREEACDAMALAATPDGTRRAYARALMDALRAGARERSPALTFTGSQGRHAMRRLKAILRPARTADAKSRAIAAGCALALAAGAGGAALASAQPVRPAAAAQAASAAAQEYRNASAADFQRHCLGDDPGGWGFCMGTLYAVAAREAERSSPRFCPPAESAQIVDLATPVIARARPAAGDQPRDLALAALMETFPCEDRGADTEVLVNGSTVFDGLPEAYGPVQVVADEVVRLPDGRLDFRSSGGQPPTRISVDGRLLREGTDWRILPSEAVERVEIDTRGTAVDFILKPGAVLPVPLPYAD